MKRILVVGPSGSGKSTVAVELAARLRLPVVHLDAHFWRPDWRQPTDNEWERQVADLAARDAWVMDGNYSRTLHLRLPRAEAVVFLDAPRRVCLARVIARWWRHRGTVRGDMAPGCRERLSWELLRYIWIYPRRRPKLLEKLRGHRTITLKSTRDVTSFLDGLESRP